MNDEERIELEKLKQLQTRLKYELGLLSARVKLLDDRLSQPAPPGSQPGIVLPEDVENADALAIEPLAPAPSHSPRPVTGAPPPLIPHASATSQRAEQRQVLEKADCDYCGGQFEFLRSAIGETMLCPHCGQFTRLASAAQKPSSQPPPLPRTVPPVQAPPVHLPPIIASDSPKAAGILIENPEPVAGAARTSAQSPSFEMRLGTYWFVRVGIVMVVTALVFFGNYAYQNFVFKLGAPGKVAMLYLASAALLGTGAWLQRKKASKTLQNYAQVLFAGGLAAVYFATYAAHHFPHLKVIDSEGLDGFLLLGWAGFIVWIADRKKSEVLALFAVLLAYYSALITHVGQFTLYSNLVLTVAAVFFLVRNRWAVISVASLAATYAAYGYWRFFNGTEWHWVSAEEGLWMGTYFLMGYWALFTAGVFLSKDEKFRGQNRAAFLTANNGAFFTMFLLTMLQVHHGGLWKFMLGYGSVLLALALLSRRLLSGELLALNAYLTQGLLLVTLGFITKYSGMELALILAIESVVLMMLGQQQTNRILLASAYIAAGLAVGWGMDGMKQFDSPGMYRGLGLGIVMVFNMYLVHRQFLQSSAFLRAGPGYFGSLALLIWLVAIWDNTKHENFPLVLAVATVPLTLSIYLLRVRELTVFGQGYLFLAQLVWVTRIGMLGAHPPPWWNPSLIIIVSLATSHWWQKQKVLTFQERFDLVWQFLCALAVVGVLYFWLAPQVSGPPWLGLTGLLALGLTVYGVTTRAWLVAATGQIFSVISAIEFALKLGENKPPGTWALAPIASLSILSFGTIGWFMRKPESPSQIRLPLLQVATFYRWTALMMSIWWVTEYVPARERIWLLALLGLLLFLIAGWRRNVEALFASAAYTVVAMALFWLPLVEGAERVYLPNLLVIVILLAQRQFARRVPERYPVDERIHSAVIVLGGMSLWLFLTRWVHEFASNYYLTASWSLLALLFFAAGIVLRERMYRWIGLGVLACALGRVVLIDVWRLETLYRILSFMALGVVLLVLGFFYTKYQEKIRAWL